MNRSVAVLNRRWKIWHSDFSSQASLGPDLQLQKILKRGENKREKMVGDVRFELTASGSGDQRSIQLS